MCKAGISEDTVTPIYSRTDTSEDTTRPKPERVEPPQNPNYNRTQQFTDMFFGGAEAAPTTPQDNLSKLIIVMGLGIVLAIIFFC